MAGPKHAGGVTIGDIHGDIQGSVIASGDVRDVTITVAGRTVAASKQPDPDEFRQLLFDIHRELSVLTARVDVHQDVLPKVSAAARNAEVTARDVAASMGPELGVAQGARIKKRLSKVAALVGTVLDGTKSVADKAGEAGKSIQTVVEQLHPLLQRVRVAVLWAAKLWPTA
jgi:hypothetical protein